MGGGLGGGFRGGNKMSEVTVEMGEVGAGVFVDNVRWGDLSRKKG